MTGDNLPGSAFVTAVIRLHNVDPVPVLNMIKPLVHRQGNVVRSEEHTSELQSLMRISYAVFCLKKKKSKLQLAFLLNAQQQDKYMHYTSCSNDNHHRHHA